MQKMRLCFSFVCVCSAFKLHCTAAAAAEAVAAVAAVAAAAAADAWQLFNMRSPKNKV